MVAAGNEQMSSQKAQPDPAARTISRQTPVPQFALDAADAKIAALSSAVVGAADTIEQFLNSSASPVPEGAREFAMSIAKKLRSLGTDASEQQAADLVQSLQRKAAAHPAAALGVGAAIGAALAAVAIRYGASGSDANRSPA